jgi:poly-beta-1,6-N-acetyl-D-glucosamine synthase
MPLLRNELSRVNPSQRYLLISPCRDEAQYLRRTLDSVAAQSVQPAAWVIVDDGSTDETPTILGEYARRLPYLRVVRRTDRGRREVGPGVIAAFYAGLKTVRLEDFDYLCKLDVDLDLPIRYFELLMQRMESDPRIGTTSGKPWFVHPQSGALAPEICGGEMSVGMTKFYRVACFLEIGGFVRQVMWDGIDCHRARMLGWIAERIDDEPLRFVHLRPQGASQKGIWTGRLRAGFGQYYMGTSPLYYLVVAVYRLPAHPAVIGSVAMLWGYLRSWLKNLPRYDDPEFRRFLRSYQHASLRMGKRAATAQVNAERANLWRASRLHREADARDDGVPDCTRPPQAQCRPNTAEVVAERSGSFSARPRRLQFLRCLRAMMRKPTALRVGARFKDRELSKLRLTENAPLATRGKRSAD